MLDPLREAVAAIVESPDGACLDLDVTHVLNSVADRTESIPATKHPLGFIHVELTRLVPGLPEGSRVRLHIWMDSLYVSDELGLVHDHAWTLKSCVLAGALTDVMLVPTAAPDGEYAGFRVNYGEENQFGPEGRWHLVERARRHVSTGQVYSLPPRTVHRTEVASFPSVTLLVTADENDGGPGPMVYSLGAESTGTSIRTIVTPTALASLLSNISSRL